jgi:hypothetical protein
LSLIRSVMCSMRSSSPFINLTSAELTRQFPLIRCHPRSSRRTAARQHWLSGKSHEFHGAGNPGLGDRRSARGARALKKTPMHTWIPTVPTLSPPESGTSLVRGRWRRLGGDRCALLPEHGGRVPNAATPVCEGHMYQYEGTAVNVHFANARGYLPVCRHADRTGGAKGT